MEPFSKKKLQEIIVKCENIKLDIRSHIVCFTGYRPQKCPWGFNENDPRCIDIKNQTKVKIENAIVRGYNTFISGMALGFDMICAELVLELKVKYPYIKLIGALPCEDQDNLWNTEQKKRYRYILSQLDAIRCIYKKYIGAKCMTERNHYMISNSSLVIALFDGKSGGTANTLADAKKQGLEIDIISF